ncbi:hypothetical protein MKW98_011361 [Papaver atlanticum]|uniref:peptidylprolyl isomerase n=1 Tax=Papaver atlanticum TaxID=357466 RepID=A0AAD4SV63_9MAGN|nr:hypothetical protein MKW98_011361 [Papaver atlanticum]
MRVIGQYVLQRVVIVPPELAYGSRGVQEIPPNATIELDIELLSIKAKPIRDDKIRFSYYSLLLSGPSLGTYCIRSSGTGSSVHL